MTPPKHQPPSRVRYAAEHPFIGVHVDLPTYARLMALREKTGLSFAQLILRTLGEVELEVETARRLGYRSGRRAGEASGRVTGREEGYAEAVAKFQLAFPCQRCGEDVVVYADTAIMEAAATYFRERGWQHADCEPPH